jgi:flagellar export protein FliJ
MADFRFSLERLLTLRERAKQDAAGQTARAQALLNAAEDTRDQMAAQCDAARDRAQAPLDALTQVSALRQASVLRDSLQQHLELSQVAVATCAHDLQVQITQLNARTRDTRVLERLKNRQHEVWQVETARAERLTMDGIAQARFLRTRSPQHDEESTQ